MEKLSIEVISIIIDQLQQDSQLARYATVSRTWQAAVEARTFARLQVDSDHLDRFRSAYSPHPRRQAALRALDFDVMLPTNTSWGPHHATFHTAFNSLFSLMHEWEKDQDASAFGSVQLRLGVHVAARRADDDADPKSLSHGVEHLQSMRPDDIASLPAVRRFDRFRIDVSLGQAIDPLTTCQLVLRLPRLQSLQLEYWDPDRRQRTPRAAYRTWLAEGIRSLRRLPRLTKLCIERRGSEEPDNHGVEVQDFRDDQGIDIVSEAVRQLAEAGILTELKLVDILVSPDLFQDRRHSDSTSPTGQAAAALPWPAMRSFIVHSGIVAPGGAWYYTGDPGAVTPMSSAESGILEDGMEDDDSDDDEGPAHWWRTRPDPDLFNPLALAMSAAVLRMPRLQAGALTVGSDHGLCDDLALQCAVPGEPFCESMGDGMRFADMEYRRWKTWIGGKTEWEVPAQVRDNWKEFVGEAGKISVVVYEL
ncbi:hypothetical protein PG999_007365 [Apiospora kogelbergensis]|uniref:F-box domain-containing protein n=1 Tax=Apiospora kogelbergensis TaxID=1337665 RepID=A0AAW0QY72_9PEZI